MVRMGIVWLSWQTSKPNRNCSGGGVGCVFAPLQVFTSVTSARLPLARNVVSASQHPRNPMLRLPVTYSRRYGLVVLMRLAATEADAGTAEGLEAVLFHHDR